MSYSSENDFYWASCQVSQADSDKGFEATSEALKWLGRGQSCGSQPRWGAFLCLRGVKVEVA